MMVNKRNSKLALGAICPGVIRVNFICGNTFLGHQLYNHWKTGTATHSSHTVTGLITSKAVPPIKCHHLTAQILEGR